MTKNESYIFGLLITDGNLSLKSRNRGRITLEISYKDKDIVEKLANVIPNSFITERVRKTNFSNLHHSIMFSNYRLEFRKFLIENGFPIENKTFNANIPNNNYYEIDFWRGVIDGDGSLGLTKNNLPFISFTTKSEFLKEQYCLFLQKYFNIKKNVKRNKRDNIYNIVVFGQRAVNLSKLLYLTDTEAIFLNRKYQKAIEMQKYAK